MLGHLMIDVDNVVDLLVGEPSSTGDEREAPYPFGRVVESHVDGGLGVDEGVFVNAGVVLMALRAPFAVFGAAAGAGVDDGAGLEMVSAEMSADFVGRLIESLLVGRECGASGLVESDVVTGLDALAESNDFFGCHVDFLIVVGGRKK